MKHSINWTKKSKLDRKYWVIRQVSRVLIVTTLLQVLYPSQAVALTTGPSQPEVMQFQQAGTSGMVDPFTGAFNYNIPLFELPGPNGSYPFNLAYQSGVTMDQEASWVGLGWSLNPGAITRTMRGLPDEFDGDEVRIDQHMKPDWTVGVTGGMSVEVFGADGNLGWTGGPNLSMTWYYNSYRGLGYRLGGGFDIGYGNYFTAGGGLNLSIDSQDGIDVSPKLTFGKLGANRSFKFALGAGYNSRRGLTDISLSGTMTRTREYQEKMSTDFGDVTEYKYMQGNQHGGSSTLYSASSAYTPIIDKEMLGASIGLSLRVGGDVVGVDPNWNVSGYYNTNFLAWHRKDIPAYGYLNMQKATPDAMTDVNRENEVLLRKESPNLAIPSLTNDIYQISGQGTGGLFRAWRNDVGVTKNRDASSISLSYQGGIELNATKAAGDVALGLSDAHSGGWENRNEAIRDANAPHKYGFHGSDGYREDYEPWYFKVEGDQGTDPTNDLAYMGGTGPVRLAVENDPDGNGRKLGKVFDRLEDKEGNIISNLLPRESYLTDQNRRPRNAVVDYVRVKEIKQNPEGFGEYAVQYFIPDVVNGPFDPNHDAPDQNLLRNHPDHHFAGMSVHQTDGTRYVYGLPAYNKKQVETVFSVDGSGQDCEPRIAIDIDSNGDTIRYKVDQTDHYLHRTEIPEYAHSYLLTSVLGQDYVDADNIPGPSDGDLGFWVKFNYVKVNDSYKWRAPFVGANLDKGQRSTIDDDKANFMYGEREEWYLASAETKTHIAEFSISPRKDNHGAKKELQNESGTGNSNGSFQEGTSYRLDEVSLYSKLDTQMPIVTVNLGYTYELCKNLPNNEHYVPGLTNANLAHPSSGKLTLTSVSFKHENSVRGANNPYVFHYKVPSVDLYDAFAQDKWGNYRPYYNECVNANYPYTEQTTIGRSIANPQMPHSTTNRQTIDDQNSAWHLTGIDLPTGGKMTVDFEANQYGYVQDKPAMEMYRVLGTWDGVPGHAFGHQVYNEDYHIPLHPNNAPFPSKAQQRRIYIDLGRTIYRDSQLDSIVGSNKDIYIKSLMNLKKPSHQLEEWVSAYLEIDHAGAFLPNGGPISQGTNIIYLEFKPCTWNDGKLTDFHPLAVAAWTHLRSNLPQLVSLPGLANGPDPGTSTFAVKQKMLSLLSAGPELARIFSGFYKNADDNLWADTFNPEMTWVRLNSLEMKKFGGGCRVKQITLTDEFSQSAPGADDVVTGVVYDYEMEENGTKISSGVAAYEPLIGGDENPLRYNKHFPAETPLMTDYSLFQQMPINESYMPAAVIGYRKVTVKSLATEQVLTGQLQHTVPTTGAVVHEFWTAKDFPVIADETEANVIPFPLNIPIPFVGTIRFNDMTASQGYSIELNNMHGKARRVSNYGIDKFGKLEVNPISWVEYEYNMQTLAPGTNKERHQLNNVVNALVNDVDANDHSRSDVQQKILGLDHEFFVDMREYDSNSGMGGAAVNADFVIIGFLPSVWPMVSYSKQLVRTAVTNKIVHRSGISTGIRAFNQGSLVKTDNLLFDAQTGRPLLTRVTNDYDAPIYNYEYPGFWAYDRMGPAYKNIGTELNNLTATTIPNGNFKVAGAGIGSGYEMLLIPGDELMVTPASGAPRKAWFVGFDGGNAQFYVENPILNGPVNLRVQKSGRRNLLQVSAEQIVSLRNPTLNRGNQFCWRDVTNPTAVVESTWVTTHIETELVPAPCLQDFMWALNHFFTSDANNANSPTPFDFFHGISWGCGDCDLKSFTLLNAGAIQVECGFGCQLSIVDASGTPMSIPWIHHISNLQIDASAPAPVLVYGSGNPFAISVDVFATANGAPATGYLSGCGSLFDAAAISIDHEVNEYHSTFTGTPSNDILATEMFMLDSVLSAKATTFSDAWMQDYSDVRFEGNNAAQQLSDLEEMHPFANGQRGVWRGKDSYVYVTDRRQSPEINTAKDGTFSGMPMFDFQSITFDDCASNWRKTNEVTRYSPYSMELENRDVLNVYCTALYGYNGNLPIAVSANADYREVGFESFEEYEASTPVNVLGLATGNLDFPTDNSVAAPNVWTYTDISHGTGVDFYLDGTMVNSILVHPITSGTPDGMVQGRTHGSIEHPSVFYGEKGLVTIATPTHIDANDAPYLHQFNNAPLQYAGRVVYQRPSLGNAIANVGNGEYVDNKAHTGTQSLMLTGQGVYPQNRLKLKARGDYSLQLWVSRDDTDVPTYADNAASQTTALGVMLSFYDETGSFISATTPFKPSGELVEGWQKIEGNFLVPTDAENVVITLQSGGTQANGFTPAYFDDIRIQPLKSKMTCYVYDPRNYKLRATLDDDNFALVYRYDEAGNLYLVQKETVEGMRTLQESRGFMVEN